MSSKRVTFPLAIPLVAALLLTLGAVPAARADDEAPTPKKVKVRVATDVDEETEVVLEDVSEDVTEEKSAKSHDEGHPRRSPLDIIHGWMASKLGEALANDERMPAHAWLKHWFEAGDDVPMADLRDALTSEGWNADSMHAWLVGEMGRSGMRLFSRVGPRMRGLQGGARAPRTFTWFGQRNDGRPAPRGRTFPQRQPGPATGAPQVHTEQRAWVLWHDGERWQRQALPGGMGGHARHRGQQRGPRPFRGAQPRGTPWRGRAARGGTRPGQMGLDADLEALLRELLNEDARPAPRRRAQRGGDLRGKDAQELMHALRRAQQRRSGLPRIRELREAIRKQRNEGAPGGGQRRGMIHVGPMPEGKKANEQAGGHDLEDLLRMLQGLTKEGVEVHGIEQLRDALKELRGALGREGHEGGGQRGNDGAPGTDGRAGQGGAGGRAAPQPESDVKRKKVRVVIER